jgi:hypothetical protein
VGVLVQGSRSYADTGDDATPYSGAKVGPPGEQVVFSVEPLAAHVFQRGIDLGAGPFLFQIPAGHPMALEVRHEGYRTRRVTLDGSQTRLGIKLLASDPPSRTR